MKANYRIAKQAVKFYTNPPDDAPVVPQLTISMALADAVLALTLDGDELDVPYDFAATGLSRAAYASEKIIRDAYKLHTHDIFVPMTEQAVLEYLKRMMRAWR